MVDFASTDTIINMIIKYEVHKFLFHDCLNPQNWHRRKAFVQFLYGSDCIPMKENNVNACVIQSTFALTEELHLPSSPTEVAPPQACRKALSMYDIVREIVSCI